MDSWRHFGRGRKLLLSKAVLLYCLLVASPISSFGFCSTATTRYTTMVIIQKDTSGTSRSIGQRTGTRHRDCTHLDSSLMNQQNHHRFEGCVLRMVLEEGDDKDDDDYTSNDFNNEDSDEEGSSSSSSDFGEDDLESAGVVLEDLSWRVEKLRLEEANKRRFLKAKPIFLPYDECRKWVQAWGRRWTCEDDWYVYLEAAECAFLDMMGLSEDCSLRD